MSGLPESDAAKLIGLPADFQPGIYEAPVGPINRFLVYVDRRPAYEDLRRWLWDTNYPRPADASLAQTKIDRGTRRKFWRVTFYDITHATHFYLRWA